MYNLAIFLYALGVRLISPFHKKAKLMVRGHAGTYRILRQKINPKAHYVWIHVASLGEFEQARPLIEAIKGEHPQFKILLTFFSPSGYEVRKDYPLADAVCYLPFDKMRNVRKFLDLAKPTLAIFVKYEFWYNYVHELWARKTPVYLVSAIFRPDQLFFKKYSGSYGTIVRYYTEIFVQDENSKKLLLRHGIKNVIVTGDTRIDRVIEIRRKAKELPLIQSFTQDAPMILVAGSTWEHDENIILDYFNAHDELKLVIAPHEIHEAHLFEIEQKLKRPFLRYSKADADSVQHADCLIMDCFGLLSSVYRYGSAAYVGGGFGAGIHNLPEAAVYGIPVIFGPNHVKFREASGLIKAGGGFSIGDKEDFDNLMSDFTHSPQLRVSAGENAKKYISNDAGATRKTLDEIPFQKWETS